MFWPYIQGEVTEQLLQACVVITLPNHYQQLSSIKGPTRM